MMLSRTPAALLSAVLAACLAAPAGAAGSDPNWPCIQVRNPEIAAPAIWSGPEITDTTKQWWSDPDVGSAARAIASRRTSMEEAQAIVERIAAGGGDKSAKLTSLFVGMLDLINGERTRIMNGLVRYAQKQRAFADRIERIGDQIAQLRAGKPVEGATKDQLPQLEEQMRWDARIFDERNQSLSYVCESPQILEQRAFDLARMIAEKLP